MMTPRAIPLGPPPAAQLGEVMQLTKRNLQILAAKRGHSALQPYAPLYAPVILPRGTHFRSDSYTASTLRGQRTRNGTGRAGLETSLCCIPTMTYFFCCYWTVISKITVQQNTPPFFEKRAYIRYGYSPSPGNNSSVVPTTPPTTGVTRWSTFGNGRPSPASTG